MANTDPRLGFPKVRIAGRHGLIALVPPEVTKEINRAMLYYTDYGQYSGLSRRHFNFWWMLTHRVSIDSVQRYYRLSDKGMRKLHANIQSFVETDQYTRDFFERRQKAYLRQSVNGNYNPVSNLQGQGRANLKQAKLKEIDSMLDKYSSDDFTFPEAEMMPSDEEEKLDMIRRRLDYFEDPDNSYPERDDESEAEEENVSEGDTENDNT